jgi:hypothetical protein
MGLEKQILCEDDRKKGKSNDNCKSVDAKFARLSEVREGRPCNHRFVRGCRKKSESNGNL